MLGMDRHTCQLSWLVARLEYAALRMFRVNVRLALKKIQLVYPELKLDVTADGMTIHPSRTAIANKS